MSRRHNDANVLVMGAGEVPPEAVPEIVKTWIETPFDGGRHQQRVTKIARIENGE